MAAKHTFTNRLAKEKSPYLLQHAHNPVDWYPWGDDAFQAAKEHDKPIFLSIGYASCHWCHAMEKESFENEEVAKHLNDAFINIKVDREELPEVDSLYMEFAQSMMAGSAGWPLNLILTPDLKPFFAATYLPPFAQQGMMGLVELIQRIQEVWRGPEREKVEDQAEKIVELFSLLPVMQSKDIPLSTQIQTSAEILFKIADPVFGGLRGAPKFPVGYQHNFLLTYSSLFKDSRALFVAERTLDMMQRGGIHDHIGGGFARYSVDEQWIVPHFEKMLYDNALISAAYVDAWRYIQKPLYKDVATQIFDYILRDMTHPEGGFYSAEDADSEGHEGWYYTWEYDQLENLLGKDKFPVFADFYGVTQEGNFEGRNVLYTPQSLEEFAEKHKLNVEKLEKELREDRAIVFAERNKRVRPFKDDKILTSWNGLMINALAEGGAAFQIPKYIEAAKRAVDFIKIYLWDREFLWRRFRDGEKLHHGSLEDYAFLIKALITLYEIGEGEEYLTFARELTERVENSFKSENGPFYQTDGSEKSIILRKYYLADGAEPSGNAVHGENLLRLYQILNDKKYLQQAEDIMKGVGNYLDHYSPGYLYHIINLMRYYDQNAPVFNISLDSQENHKEELKKAIHTRFIPNKALVWISPSDPIAKTYPAKDGKTTLYICKKNRCQEPINDIVFMKEAIHRF